jgi:hypothetical protein
MTPQTLTAERREKFETILRDTAIIRHGLVALSTTYTQYEADTAIRALCARLAEASLSRSERATDEQPAEYNTAKPEIDKVAEWLKMSQFPGAKKAERVDNILSYCAVTLHRTTTSKEWQEFAKWIDDRQQKDKQNVEVFAKWMLGQKGYDPQFWPIKKMMELWPSAFVGEVAHKTQGPKGLPEKEDIEFVPAPERK